MIKKQTTCNFCLKDYMNHLGIMMCLLTILFMIPRIGVFANGTFNKEMALQSHITGTVTDSVSNEPLVGVSIVVEGTSQGTISDANGKFSLDLTSKNPVLIFSYVGFVSQKIAYAGQATISIKLSSTFTRLDEVVVVGYGVQKKKLVTGATLQVKGDDLVKLSTVSPMTAMQSQSPGVDIVPLTGEPGSAMKVNIRGIGTIANSNPIYIVDGGVRGNIDYLNPDDIESIDILKDAASAAIYGARAANGVVLVTTKKGVAGKVQVSYNGFAGYQNLYKILPMLDAKEYIQIQNEANVNSGGVNFTPAWWASNLISAPSGTFKPLLSEGQQRYNNIEDGTWSGSHWLSGMQKNNAQIQSHSITIAGGSQYSTYSLGFSYLDQDGIMGSPVESHYTRYTFRINSDHVLWHENFDILKFGENLQFMTTTSHTIPNAGFYWNFIRTAISGLPILPKDANDPADPAFPYHSPLLFDAGYTNPNAALIENSYNTNFSMNLDVNTYLEFQPLKGLKYRAAFTIDPNASTYRGFSPTYYLGPASQQTTNTTSQNSSVGINDWLFENTINYKFTLLHNNDLDVLAGMSAEKDGIGTYVSASNTNSVYNDFSHAYLNNTTGATPTVGGNPYGPHQLASYFGRINYDYKEKYLLSLIARADGSSNFAPGHRWGTFPSISAGWVITSEPFMQPVKSVMDFLKIRISWGQNGNEAIPPFQYVSAISGNNPNGTNGSTPVYSNYYFGNSKTTPTPGTYPFNLPTPNLTWETSEQTDIGLDARFLNSRLSLVADYYDKTTKDWLVAAPTLAYWGSTNAPFINGGTISNKGIEIGLVWKDKIADFHYGVNVNFTYNKNEVTTIDNGTGYIPATVGNTALAIIGNGEYIARAQVGHPIGYFWGFKTAGIFQSYADVQNWKNAQGGVLQPTAQPGDVKFVSTSGGATITDADKTQIGDPNPHEIFSFNLNAQYKGFDFSVATYGVAGNQIIRSWHDAGSFHDNFTTEILNRWHGPGTSNRIPRVLANSTINTQYTSDLNIENGDYLKISNITLGYDFKNLIKSNILFSQLRVFVTGENVFTFTKYSGMDPAIGTSTNDGTNNIPWVKGVDIGFYPNPRVYKVGASLKF